MRKKISLPLVTLCAALGLAACATAPMYQPASGERALGYRDYPIENNRYRVSYRAKTPEAAEQFALRRAADLTVQNGYDWFEVVNRSADRSTTARSGSSISIGGGTGGSGVSLGGGIGFGLGSGSTGNSLVSLEVLMGSGPRPDGPNVYDAAAIRMNIQG